MSRYIDADVLKESLKNLKAKANNKKYEQGLQDAIDGYFPQIIDNAPTADVQPVKRAQWNSYVCSECNVCADYFISGDFYFDEKPNFCPNCGAEMNKEE